MEKEQKVKADYTDYRDIGLLSKYVGIKDTSGIEASLTQAFKTWGMTNETAIKDNVASNLQNPKSIDNYISSYLNQIREQKVVDFANTHAEFLKERLGEKYSFYMGKVKSKPDMTMQKLEYMIKDAQEIKSKIAEGRIKPNSNESKKAEKTLELYGAIYDYLMVGEDKEVEKMRPDIEKEASIIRTKKADESITRLYKKENPKEIPQAA
ncbi:MAG: hypothetical protein ABFQ65_01315 [Nanoarchaeota archaeon]